jgi:HSP20 family protein
MSKDDDIPGGFSKLTSGLASLITLLTDLEKKGELPRSGRREKNGVTVEYSLGGRPLTEGAPAADEPEAPRPVTRPAQPVGLELVEPTTDIFDEAEEILLLFELPGVRLGQIRCLLDGDILLLDAKTETRLYRKELLIEAALADEKPRLQLRNGVLEVRLRKKPAPL